MSVSSGNGWGPTCFPVECEKKIEIVVLFVGGFGIEIETRSDSTQTLPLPLITASWPSRVHVDLTWDLLVFPFPPLLISERGVEEEILVENELGDNSFGDGGVGTCVV